jgi:hypothetical protein
MSASVVFPAMLAGTIVADNHLAQGIYRASVAGRLLDAMLGVS